MTKQALRVQRHRAQMVKDGSARMEVELGRKFIKQAREFARQKRMPFWLFVQEALLAYAATLNAATGNAAETGNGK